MWLIILSDQLPIAGLVSHYPTNYLIGRRLLVKRITALAQRLHAVLAPVSQGYPPLNDKSLRDTHPSATEAEASVRLACVKHAASVRSEPGSNSQVHPSPHRSKETNKQNPNTQNQTTNVIIIASITSNLQSPLTQPGQSSNHQQLKRRQHIRPYFRFTFQRAGREPFGRRR